MFSAAPPAALIRSTVCTHSAMRPGQSSTSVPEEVSEHGQQRHVREDRLDLRIGWAAAPGLDRHDRLHEVRRCDGHADPVRPGSGVHEQHRRADLVQQLRERVDGVLAGLGVARLRVRDELREVLVLCLDGELGVRVRDERFRPEPEYRPRLLIRELPEAGIDAASPSSFARFVGDGSKPERARPALSTT